MTTGTAGWPFAAVRETHTGVVFFVGDRAYKLKKPVHYGFVDFRSREARLAACRREVELNRRLAPDVYLGVADVLDAGGRACDHLVVMRRLPEDRRLADLVAAGAPVEAELGRLARLLAEFHAGADRSARADEAAGSEALTRRWAANSAEMARLVGPVFDAGVVDRVDRLARRYLAGRGPLFGDRVAAGRACDGHGDLLAEDIFCLEDGPRVLDCLEFDDGLRLGDVLADVAFLAMDLERLGRPELAYRHPAAVDSLVLVNSIGSSTWSGSGTTLRTMSQRPLWDWGLHFPAALWPLRQARKVLPVIVSEAVGNMARHPLTFLKVADIARRADLTDALDALKWRRLPVAVFWGKRDQVITRDSFEQMCRTLGNPTAVTVDGSHGWMIADPEAFGEVMTNVLAVVAEAGGAVGELPTLAVPLHGRLAATG